MIKLVFKIFIKKFFEVLAALFFLGLLCFLLLRILPGGPFTEDVILHPMVQQNLVEKWGLHQPVLSQLVHYLGSLINGDWGLSMAHPDKTVLQMIAQGLGQSLGLSLVSLFFVLTGAFILSFVAVFFGGWSELLIDQLMIAMISLPSLFWGPLLIYIFGFYFNLLPIAFLSSPVHYILPVITLGMRPLATLVRLLKNAMLVDLRSDYVRTARAKGQGPLGLLFHHVLRNSLIPVLSYLGPLIAALLSGSFLVETLFAIPGVGSLFIVAINDRDYTLILGLTVLYGLLLILCNSIMDMVMSLVDPRLREKA